MKNKIVALILFVSCLFSLTSCSLYPIYNSSELINILKKNDYEIEDVDEEVQEGIIGYIYGSKESTGDEIYYIYCEDISSARSIYNYMKSTHKAKIADIKMQIDKVEFALYKSDGISAAEKGDYYERYIELTEELEEIEKYTYGHGLNLVWYGTKQAVADIKNG